MNPSPSLQGALWSGNQQLATKKQLLSSISGLYTDIQTIEVSSITAANLNVSTLTAHQWISAPYLNVSTIRAENLDISGISFDASGLLYAPLVSSSQGIFNITNVSVMQLSFKPTFTGNIEVSFNLGLGEAIGGFLAGLGSAVGGALIGVGTGAGLAISGAEQGIATMIAGRPQNFITQNTYETINFTSQLQVSTLGNAQPAYSTIFRTVSSSSANSVPGPEMFTSTIFYPGQICIRTVSDPFNLITGNSNLNTSTIQSFGQWTPLEGLEPENIVANGVVANTISTGNFFATLAKTDVLESYTVITSNLGVGQNASFNYQAPLEFQTGSSNYAAFEGYLNRLYCYNNTGYIFSGAGGTQESASLYLGTNTNESILNISTINSVGSMKTVSLYASTITAEQLNVVSTFFLTSTNVEIITSTITVVTDNLFATDVSIANFISSFSFTTPLGNPTGPYDINRNNYVVSTTFNSVSSLTQNILNYTLTEKIQEESVFSAWSPTVEIYTVSPQNVNQWASTMLYCNPGADIGGLLAITYPSSFFTAGLTGTFDLTVDMTTNAFSMGAEQYQTANPGGGILNTFFYQPPATGFSNTYRFEIDSNGIASMITPAPPPYETINSNIFTMSQNITDTYITATDRLHIEAGDILLQGTLNLDNTNINTLNVNTLNADSINTTYLSPFIQTNSTQGTSNIPNLIEVDYTASLGYVSSLASTPTQILTYAQAGFLNNYTSQISTTAIRPVLNVAVGTGSVITLQSFGDYAINGYKVPGSNWAYGTMNIDAGAGSAISIASYGLTTATTQPILNLSNAGATTLPLAIFGLPGTSLPPFSGVTIIWNGTAFTTPQPYTPWSPALFTITDDFQINQSYRRVEFDTSIAQFTGSLTVASNAVVDGPMRIGGQLTTFVPSGGYAGIEVTSYTDAPSWTFDTTARWESGAQNFIPRPIGGYYKTSDWTPFVTVRGFNTPDYTTSINGWTAYATPSNIGGVNYWSLYRFIQIIHVGPPSAGTFDCDIIMFPNNFTT